MRFRPWVVLGAALVCLTALTADQARAAATVSRLSLVLSGIPTSINGKEFNDEIEVFNKTKLDPIGYENLKKLTFGWMFDGELRYFVRPNFAVSAGVSHLRVAEDREFLPSISTGVTLHTEILTVPLHVGGAYYLQPYNQGDFQARAFFGAGLMQYTYNRIRFQQTLSMSTYDSALVANSGGSYHYSLTQDAPGYYLEGGGHMFFASRLSALISVNYRSGRLRAMRLQSAEFNGAPPPVPLYSEVKGSDGSEYYVDLGGVGVRMAVAIGF